MRIGSIAFESLFLVIGYFHVSTIRTKEAAVQGSEHSANKMHEKDSEDSVYKMHEKDSEDSEDKMHEGWEMEDGR